MHTGDHGRVSITSPAPPQVAISHLWDRILAAMRQIQVPNGVPRFAGIPRFWAVSIASRLIGLGLAMAAAGGSRSTKNARHPTAAGSRTAIEACTSGGG